jgi:hypothetical protein
MTAKTPIERDAIEFVKNYPEIQTYTETDLYCSGASAILRRIRDLVNDHALVEPKSAYERGLHDGLLWAWERTAEMFVNEGDDLETLLGGRSYE